MSLFFKFRNFSQERDNTFEQSSIRTGRAGIDDEEFGSESSPEIHGGSDAFGGGDRRFLLGGREGREEAILREVSALDRAITSRSAHDKVVLEMRNLARRAQFKRHLLVLQV